MEKLLSESLSLFGRMLHSSSIEAGYISTDIDKLCGMVRFITREPCTKDNIIQLLQGVEYKNPTWYSFINSFLDTVERDNEVEGYTQLMAVIKEKYPDLKVQLHQCPLRDRSNDKPRSREKRKPLHLNVPLSVYGSIAEPVKAFLKAIRKAENAGEEMGDKRILCMPVPTQDHQGAIFLVERYIKEENIKRAKAEEAKKLIPKTKEEWQAESLVITDQRMMEKMLSAGFDIDRQEDGSYIYIDGGEVIGVGSICDLYNQIYGSRIYYQETKPKKQVK